MWLSLWPPFIPSALQTSNISLLPLKIFSKNLFILCLQSLTLISLSIAHFVCVLIAQLCLALATPCTVAHHALLSMGSPCKKIPCMGCHSLLSLYPSLKISEFPFSSVYSSLKSRKAKQIDKTYSRVINDVCILRSSGRFHISSCNIWNC